MTKRHGHMVVMKLTSSPNKNTPLFMMSLLKPTSETASESSDGAEMSWSVIGCFRQSASTGPNQATVTKQNTFKLALGIVEVGGVSSPDETQIRIRLVCFFFNFI